MDVMVCVLRVLPGDDIECGTSRTFDSFGSQNLRKQENHVIQF